MNPEYRKNWWKTSDKAKLLAKKNNAAKRAQVRLAKIHPGDYLTLLNEELAKDGLPPITRPTPKPTRSDDDDGGNVGSHTP